MSVELPPFVVTDLPDDLPWKYASVSGIEVLSLCDAEVTREFIDAELRGRLFLPEFFQGLRSRNASIILFNQKSENRHVAPQRGVFKASDRRWGKDRMWQEFHGCITLSDRASLIVAANLYGISDWVSVDTGLSAQMLFEQTPAIPAWILEGLFAESGALAIGGYIDQDGVRLPELVWLTPNETEALLKDPKKAPAMLSFNEVFVSRPPDRNLQPERYALWRSQVILFSRWALYGPAPSPQGAAMFWQFAYLASKGAVSEDTFRTCFGQSYQEACFKMSAYLRSIIAKPTDVRVPNLNHPLRETKNLKLRLATESEIARILGNWEIMEAATLHANFPELSERYNKAARHSFLHVTETGRQDPAFLDALGIFEYGAGDEKKARLHLETAAAARNASSLGSLALAKLRLAEYRSKMTSGQKLQRTTLDSVLAPLFVAKTQKPAIKEIYQIIADVLAQAEVQPPRDQLAAVKEGSELFPEDSSLLLSAATLYDQFGYRDEALALANRGMRTSSTPEMQQRFGWLVLKGSLPPH